MGQPNVGHLRKPEVKKGQLTQLTEMEEPRGRNGRTTKGKAMQIRKLSNVQQSSICNLSAKKPNVSHLRESLQPGDVFIGRLSLREIIGKIDGYDFVEVIPRQAVAQLSHY